MLFSVTSCKKRKKPLSPTVFVLLLSVGPLAQPPHSRVGTLLSPSLSGAPGIRHCLHGHRLLRLHPHRQFPVVVSSLLDFVLPGRETGGKLGFQQPFSGRGAVGRVVSLSALGSGQQASRCAAQVCCTCGPFCLHGDPGNCEVVILT